MARSVQSFIFYLVLWFFMPQAQAVRCVITHDTQSFSQLALTVPDTFFVANLTLRVPPFFERDTAAYVCPISAHALSTRATLITGIKALFKTKRFSAIHITCRHAQSTHGAMPALGYDLVIDCLPARIFGQLAITGIFWGKERYKTYYTTAPGDLFDEDRHAQSVKAIEAALCDEGYCAAHVHDTIEDHASGFVQVTLTLEKGKQFSIREATVHCADTHLQKKLSKRLRYVSASLYTKETVDGIAHSLTEYLIKKGYCSAGVTVRTHINASAGTVDCVFAVTQGPKARFECVGNTFFSAHEIHALLEPFGAAGALLPPSVLAEEIKAAYIKKGFCTATVRVTEEQECTFFCITEGKRFVIDSVVITGDVPHDTSSDGTAFFERLRAQVYDTEILKKQCDMFVDRAIQDGFWDASADHAYTIDEHGLCVVTITRTFGKRRMLRSVSVPQYPELHTYPQFAPYVQCVEPVPFPLQRLQEQQQSIIDYLHKKGMLYATCKPEFTEHERGIAVTWQCVGEQTPVRFGKTYVIGNSGIAPQRLLSELAYTEGDVWSKAALNDSLKKLKSFGVFDSISLYPCDITSKDVVKDVYLKVIEDARLSVLTRAGVLFVSRNFDIRGGWSYMAGGSLVYKNLTGRADVARFDVDIHRYKHTIRGIYIQPRFFSLPLKTEYSVYINRYDQPFVIGSRNRLYRLDQDGFLVGFARTEGHWQMGCSIGSEYMRIHKLSQTLARAIDFAPWLIDRWVPYGYIEPSFFLEYLDNKLQPHRGLLTMITAKCMGSYTLSQALFFKVLVEQSFFVPVGRNIVGALRIRAGHLFNQAFSRIMPNERFYLGGAYSLRGYPPDLAPPVNLYECGGQQYYVPLGGKSMINMNLELRFPVYGNIGGVAFTDWGALAQNHPAELKAGIVGAYGFGLRYMTPVGPLRFDIGWKWKQQPGEPQYAWFLTLGNAF